MKLNILKKLGLNKKKWGLCLMLAGFAAFNVGFTNQVNEIEAADIAKAEVASVADFSAINDTKLETNNEYISNINTDKITAIEPAGEGNTFNPLYYEDYGYNDYVDVISMEATAYLPTDGDGQCITATGIRATYGIAAVDPYVIPLGTRLYIPGYGEALAADTGGAIIGYRIDLCMESYDECMEFGRRNVNVYILR